MDENKIFKGAIEITDKDGRIAIPDIANEYAYFTELMYLSGFDTITIETKKANSIGFTDSSINFGLVGTELKLSLGLHDYSLNDKIQCFFYLTEKEDSLTGDQAAIVLESIMSIYLYWESNSPIQLMRSLMEGASFSKNEVRINEY